MNKHQVTVSIESWSPEMAQHALNHNKNKRHIQTATARRYRADMLAGEWHLGACMLSFDEDGTLADGHHRLTALSLCPSGTRIDFCVSRGQFREPLISKTDTGPGRSFANYLQFKGEKYATIKAAVTKNLWSLRSGWKKLGSWNLNLSSYDELYDVLTDSKHVGPAVQDYAQSQSEMFRKTTKTPLRSLSMFIHLTDMFGEPAKLFWGPIMSGEAYTLGKRDPRYVTLQTLQRLKLITQDDAKAWKRTFIYQMKVIVHGWNAWARGKRRSHFQVRREDAIVHPMKPTSAVLGERS